MKPRLLAGLMQLRPLGSSNAGHGATRCKICGSPSLMFDIVDFNKICSPDYYLFGFSGIPVPYYRCQCCDLIFTDLFDDWTREDFATYLYNDDYPLIDGDYAAVRPARMAGEMAVFLAEHRAARILDYGSGLGVFAERLRAEGFAAVENYDPYASPRRPAGEFDIVTCFETIEHSPFPRETIADLRSFMKPGGCIIFSTLLQPPNIDELRANWWYVAPRNGHVSIYTSAALDLLAAGAGLQLFAGDGGLAFAGSAPAPQLAPLLRAIGPAIMVARLTAPAADPPTQQALVAARSADWHAVEQSGPTRFRWTQTGRIEWTLTQPPTSYPCRLTLTLPFVMEIVPGFADRCVIEVGSQAYPVRREGTRITAMAELDQPLQRPLVLITPEPQRPCDLGASPDQRLLGLAVPLSDEAG